MKRIRLFIMVLFASVMLIMLGGNTISAKELLKEKQATNIFGDILGSIYIYDNGQIVIKYRYGLRKAEVYYCEKGNNCDNNLYSVKVIAESDLYNNYKNNESGLAEYNYTLTLSKNKDYRIRVKAYVGNGSNYTGSESVNGSPIITSFQTETDEYISGDKTGDPSDKGIKGLLNKLRIMANTVVIPIIYIATGLLLVIKGALLGTQIVKSADNPDIRAEKVHALKWLVIGVGITYAANTVVGLLTGFFQNML